MAAGGAGIIPEHESYSISDELDGACVLLTGATGYVGSLVLELLLRSTKVRDDALPVA